MWDVDSHFVRQGAAATCWHPTMYKWKGFSFCASSHGRFHWKEVMHLLLSQEGFFIYGFRSSQSSLNTRGPFCCTFPFLSVSLPAAELLSSGSRARGRTDAFASLELTDSENNWVNQIFHDFPSVLKSSWNGIFLFRYGQQWDCLREKKNLRILLWKHNILMGLVLMKTVVVAAWYSLKTCTGTHWCIY